MTQSEIVAYIAQLAGDARRKAGDTEADEVELHSHEYNAIAAVIYEALCYRITHLGDITP